MPRGGKGVGDLPSSAGFVVLGVRDFRAGRAARRDQFASSSASIDRKETRARNVRGSGIGLSLVRHIVEAHGGRVVVTSPVESGRGKAPGLAVRVFLPAPVCCRRQVRRCAGRSSH